MGVQFPSGALVIVQYKHLMNLILASQSAGRKKLLEEAGFSFKVIPSTINEDVVKADTPEEEIRLRTKLKGENVVKKIIDKKSPFSPFLSFSLSPLIVLSADSGAILGKEHFEKPKDFEDGMRILKSLSGKRHKFLTAFQLIFLENGKEVKRIQDEDVSFVTFNVLTDEQIRSYLTHSPNFTKYAGGYAIASESEKFIKQVEGSVSNVIGLPMEKIIPIFQRKDTGKTSIDPQP